MDSEITEYSHPDSIWTWKSNARSRKASVWIPYFEGVEKVKGTTYRFAFNGGPITLDLKDIDCILLYGAAGSMPVDFLDALAARSIVLLIHRRNIPDPFVFWTANTTDQADLLTKQILYRQDERRRLYVARTLIAARATSMRWLISVPTGRFAAISAARHLQSLRQVEADLTKYYWSRYYERLNLPHLGRRTDHPINVALDAGSFFAFGVVLRWVLFHRLSPAHGFMHEPTQYQSLVYDLMEPYRHLFEVAVHDAWLENDDGETLTARSLSILKTFLADDAYVGAARSTAKRKSLLHAVVLALRAYLLNEMPRFVIPIEGGSLVGRPPKLSYGVPGSRLVLHRRKSMPPGLERRENLSGGAAAF